MSVTDGNGSVTQSNNQVLPVTHRTMPARLKRVRAYINNHAANLLRQSRTMSHAPIGAPNRIMCWQSQRIDSHLAETRMVSGFEAICMGVSNVVKGGRLNCNRDTYTFCLTCEALC